MAGRCRDYSTTTDISPSIIAEELNDIADDDVFTTLEVIVCRQGRGRRPDPPNQSALTKRILLQFWLLRHQHLTPWLTIENLATKVFPYVRHIRTWIDRAVSEFKTLIRGGYPADRQVFFAESYNYDVPGPHCEKLGVSCSMLLGDPPLQPLPVLTNGAVCEILTFLTREKCKSSYINQVFASLLGVQDNNLMKKAEKVLILFRLLNKSKTRNSDTIQSMLEDNFSAKETKSTICIEKKLEIPKNRWKSQVTQTAVFSPECDNCVDYGMLEIERGHLQASCLQKQTQVMDLERSLEEVKTNTTLKVKRLKEKNVGLKHKLQDEEESKEKKIQGYKSKLKSLQTQLSNLRINHEHMSKENKRLTKANKDLQYLTEVLEDEQNNQSEISVLTREGNRYNDGIRKCVMALQGECSVPAGKCRKVIQVVAKYIFATEIPDTDLPSESTAVKMADEAHVLSKLQVTENLLGTERWDLHTDGTTRDHKKIVGQQVTINSGQNFSLGFIPVDVEDSSTLLDVTINLLEELSLVYDDQQQKAVFDGLLCTLFATMADRASVNKKFNKNLNEYKQKKLGTEEDLHFLHCNAHFLLGLSAATEETMKEVEAQIESEVQHKIGRCQDARFKFFSSPESSPSRLIRLGCDSLGPRGDEKNGCKTEWEAYLDEKQKRSVVGSFRSNRFNNLYHGGAALYHHQRDIVLFLAGGFRQSLNLKLCSVLADLNCEVVVALLRALGIVYHKVTGPFWMLLQSNTHYLNLYLYIQQMITKFRLWSIDPSDLLLSETPCIFIDHALPDQVMTTSLYESVTLTSSEHTKEALKSLMKAFITVTERQLSDFLPGGRYGSQASEELHHQMKHCRLHNLVSEYAFGDLDYSQHRRRHSSLHHHSTLHMLKRNQTISTWMEDKPPEEQQQLLKVARRKGPNLRLKHKAVEKKVLEKVKLRMKKNKEKKDHREMKKREKKQVVSVMVHRHGGPCQTKLDVDRILRKCFSRKAKQEALKWELKYLKEVIGMKKGRLLTTTGVNDISVLKGNLLTVLHELPTTVSLPVQVAEPTSDVPIDPVQVNPPSSYRFDTQGTWVAVAYDIGWFVGQVTNVQSPSNATVQFLQHIRGPLYAWPKIEDVDEVHIRHVFQAQFEVTAKNCRTFTVPHKDLVQAYERVKDMYM